jgi:hypothetical protein
MQVSGGRTWWAHFEFTRINIAPIILRKKIEDRLIVGAFCHHAADSASGSLQMSTIRKDSDEGLEAPNHAVGQLGAVELWRL